MMMIIMATTTATTTTTAAAATPPPPPPPQSPPPPPPPLAITTTTMCHELPRTSTFTWPRRNRVKIMYNTYRALITTSGAYHNIGRSSGAYYNIGRVSQHRALIGRLSQHRARITTSGAYGNMCAIGYEGTAQSLILTDLKSRLSSVLFYRLKPLTEHGERNPK